MRLLAARLLPLLLAVAASSCHSGGGSLSLGPRTADVCEVHYQKLESRKVAISYGLPPPRGKDDPTSDQTARLFPHRTRNVEGGCMVGTEKSATLKVCTDCDAAYGTWLAGRR